MIKKDWLEKTARDTIALGSIIFYSLVIGRALVGPFWIFFTYLISSAIFLLIIFTFYKKIEIYLARGIILLAGTIYFYGDTLFTVFAIIVYSGMIFSSSFLGNSRIKIVKGILFGLLSTAAGYFTAELLFERPWY